MAFRCVVALVFLLSGSRLVDGREGVLMSANPIRRVVNMLQMMQQKVTKEGEEEKKLFEKFMCFCEGGAAKLAKAVEDAEAKIPQVESSMESAGGENKQLVIDVTQHKKDREAAKAAMAEATGLREKENAAFTKEAAENKANIEAMAKAIASLEAGAGSGFLQTPAASVLRRAASSMDMEDSDRELVTSFLSQGQGDSEQYAPQSGQITGILKQMHESMEKELADATADEEKSKEDYEALIAAKTKEDEALTRMVEEKMGRLGEVGVELVNMAEDLDNTKEALVEDKKFLKNLDANCATKKAEWDERCKVRADEQMALADTIKLLNDDDALDLFKKTIPSPSFLQMQVTAKEVLKEAQRVLRDASHGARDFRLNLVALALRGRKVNFDKVTAMIDNMVKLLHKEQADDEEKKGWCEAEFDSSEDKQKALERTVSDLEKTIEDNKASVASLTEELAALEQGIKDLDKEVAEATEQRQAENAEFKETSAASAAAVQILGIAKNRLNKFYNPKLYKAAPKRELSESERITVNMGGELAPTAAPGGIAGTGVTSFLQVSSRSKARDAPGPAPEAPGGEYKKSSEESSGVIGMIDLLVKDVTKEMQEAEFEEKDSQKEYEQLMEDSAAKRAADAKSVEEKEAAKADLQAALQRNGQEKKATMLEAMANAKYISDLHRDCDWLISNFDTRKSARTGEVDALTKAKAVLSGADYSFLQTSRSHLRKVRRA